jgi:hypothetical protein
VIKTVILCLSRAKVSKVISGHTNRGKTSAKRKSRRKSTLTDRDRRTLRMIISKNHITTEAQVTAELNIPLEDPVSTETVRC